jgi:hypothetical protein
MRRLIDCVRDDLYFEKHALMHSARYPCHQVQRANTLLQAEFIDTHVHYSNTCVRRLISSQFIYSNNKQTNQTSSDTESRIH